MFLIVRILIIIASIMITFPARLTHGATVENGSSYTLEQCYLLALARSEIIASQIELINQAEEHILEHRASFSPTVNFSSNLTTQQTPDNPLLQSVFSANQATAQVTAKENLFNGFRDFAVVRQKTSEKEAARYAKAEAEVRLFEDTAQSFYNVLAYEHDISNFENEIAANQKRKEDLKARIRVAQARESDLVSVESAIASLEAVLSNAMGLLSVAREVFAFLTGLPNNTAVVDVEIYPQQLGEPEKWMESYERRPDIQEAKWNLNAAERGVHAAQGGYYPSVDLLADYYLTRPGLYSGINWDLQLNITLPLFSGGLIQSQVRDAESQMRQKETVLSQTKREAERDIRSAYNMLKADLIQVSKLEKAAELAQRNYELLLKDNQFGNVSNIDLLQALANAHQLKRGRDHARFNAKLDYAKLQAVSSARDLSSPRDPGVNR
ncbi:MAG: TolC family protein [Nitrospirae bacterium]|nr:TolC family protein [Nitrospirota bacterium]MBI3595149.1 TolC family protein [Nitrospirota bacterium]